MEKDTEKEVLDKASWERLGLEEIVQIANRIGLQYAAAKGLAEECALLRPSVKARVMMRLDTGGLTEAKLLRLTETDAEYVDFLQKMADAKRDADTLRVRYESYKNLFEAKRSILSYQKAEMKLV